MGASFVPYLSYTSVGYVYYCGPNNQMNYTDFVYSNFVYHDQLGGGHLLDFSGHNIPNSPGPSYGCAAMGSWSSGTGRASDGSGYTWTNAAIPPGVSSTVTMSSGGAITAPIVQDGLQPSLTNFAIQDANGNKIDFNASNNQFTDTTGNLVLTISGTNPITYTYTSPTGSVHSTVNYTNYNIKTNFACSGIAEYTSTGTVALVSSVVQPDGTSYSFTYETTPNKAGYYTGRIASVKLPTGGTITYQYNGLSCQDGSTAGITRILNPGGTWSYTHGQVSGNEWSTNVWTPPDPQNQNQAPNITSVYFQRDPNTGNFYETQRTVNQGGGTPLLSTTTCYNNHNSNCTTTAVSPPITQTSVTLQYPNNGQASKVVTFYNSTSGVVTETDQYGLGASGTPGSLARKTQIAYASLGNIVDHPSSVTVTDGSGNLLSKKVFGYDEYSLQTPTGTTPQHVSVTGSRGNATTITSTVIGTTTLSQHVHYFDTGRVYQSVDASGATTTYNYPDANSTCGNTFPTSVTPPIASLATSTTWNCSGGVATSGTDANGNQATTTYTDPYFWRPASAVAPYQPGNSTTTTFAYTPYNSSTGVFAHTDTQMLFGSSVSEQLTTVNQFGQPVYSQQHEGPGSPNWDSTQVLYDAFNRGSQGSMPCVSATTTFTDQNLACPSAATTTTTYDALGRPTKRTDGGGGVVQITYTENDVKTQIGQIGPPPAGESPKTKQMEYDALGRLTSVCENTNLDGSGPCGQTNALNGYFTSYAYGMNASGYPTMTVSQGPAGSVQTRVYTYDLLGRMISEQNPENATTSYSYDSDSSGACLGTYPGDLVKVEDAKHNKICYQYDVLHRVTSITYPSSGPDSANTPSKAFVYDSATFNGTAMSNPKGRLVEAYTGPVGAKTTDEFLSYSVRGELTDTWQCTPNSGSNGCASVNNYYHISVGFWANGAVASLSSNISGIPAQTYGVDSMGRSYSVTANSQQNPNVVSNTVYSLSAFTTTLTFGSGDSDVFTSDPNTGRMTQYKFNVGSTSLTGNLSWNQNGSLGQMAINDTIPGTQDTQTCNYTHDDLARIATVGCVNGSTPPTPLWNQSFTYDSFGNITKNSSGPGITFLPGYDRTKNWISSLPGATPVTDANGRMTYDGTHNYTWDAESKMVAVDTTTVTYDALGRMVEKNVGGVYTQIVYAPMGNKYAVMSGQTLQKAFIPLPTGAQAVYNSSGQLAYYRHPDHLGSKRLATTPNRTLYSSTAYAPFGETYAETGTRDRSFTGKDEDTTSGMYDFLARRYSPVQGRWLSPDPAGLGAVDRRIRRPGTGMPTWGIIPWHSSIRWERMRMRDVPSTHPGVITRTMGQSSLADPADCPGGRMQAKKAVRWANWAIRSIRSYKV